MLIFNIQIYKKFKYPTQKPFIDNFYIHIVKLFSTKENII